MTARRPSNQKLDVRRASPNTPTARSPHRPPPHPGAASGGREGGGGPRGAADRGGGAERAEGARRVGEVAAAQAVEAAGRAAPAPEPGGRWGTPGVALGWH